MEINDKLKVKFEKGLLTHNISYDYFAKNYKYYGGSEGRHGNYFKLLTKYTDEKAPPYTYYCVCGHDIKENCFVKDTITGNILVIGNCCIKKFMLINNGRTCELCGATHKNRTHNLCKDCNLIQNPSLVKEKKECIRCKNKHRRNGKYCSSCCICGNSKKPKYPTCYDCYR